MSSTNSELPGTAALASQLISELILVRQQTPPLDTALNLLNWNKKKGNLYEKGDCHPYKAAHQLWVSTLNLAENNYHDKESISDVFEKYIRLPLLKGSYLSIWHTCTCISGKKSSTYPETMALVPRRVEATTFILPFHLVRQWMNGANALNVPIFVMPLIMKGFI